MLDWMQGCQMAVITATFQKSGRFKSWMACRIDALKRGVFHVLKCERASKVENGGEYLVFFMN